MCAPDRIERPTTSTSSCSAASAIISGRLAQPGVDDLEPLVAQAAGEDLRAAVVAVEAGLGDEDADRRVVAHAAPILTVDQSSGAGRD